MEDRRLAAIMFTDIVGYTALMGSDEKKAFEVLRRNRNIQKPIIKKYRGKWLKEMGDGILASFDTASDAVRCAGEIQNQAKKEGIELRIGIHTGEVVFEGNDVLGDGVNVASRLEEMAEKGCIYISGSVYKDIKNKEGIQAEFIEEKSLKNVDEPVRIYRVECEESEIKPFPVEKQKTSIKKVIYFILAGVLVIIVGGLIWYRLLKRTVGEIEKSIAVLPFKNIGGSNDNQILCDGMLEEILNNLQHISDLNVLSRTSVEKYQNASLDIKKIGEELNTGNILEGSVRMQGEKFRITAQLIHAKTGYHLWSGNFDGTLSDTIFIVQSIIAEEIAKNLNVAITQSEREQISKIPTSDYNAYVRFVIGRNYLWNYHKANDIKDLEMAEQYYRESLDIDPEFVRAYSGLAHVFGIKENWDSLNYYADKIIKYDPTDCWGYYHKGKYYVTQGDLVKAIETYKKAIKINPNFIWVYNQIGMTYCFGLNDFLAGFPYMLNFEKLRIKQDVRPDQSFYGMMGNIYLSVGDYYKADFYFKKSLEINKLCWVSRDYCINIGLERTWETALQEVDSLLCNISLCESTCNEIKYVSFYYLKEYNQALTYFNNSIENGYKPDLFDSVTLAFIYGKLGKENEATELINMFQKSIESLIQKNKDSQGYDLGYLYLYLSQLHLMLNEKDKALNCLNKAEEYEPGICYFYEKDPAFEKLHDDPEFKALVKRAQNEKAALRAQIKEMEERGELNL